MGDEIKLVHTKKEFEDFQRIKAKMQDSESEQDFQSTDNNSTEEEQAMTVKKDAPPEEKPQKAEAAETKEGGTALPEDPKFVNALLHHLNATRMTAGQLDLLLDKLELQFDQLVHGKLVGQLKQTDEYTFAKEYLDMEIQPMKDVIERMKKMVAALQNKQITLNDDLSEAKKEMNDNLSEVRKEVGADVERRMKTISTKIDDEIQRTKRNLDEQGRGLRNELVDSIKKERNNTEESLKDIRAKFEEENAKVKDSLTEMIKHEREKLEKENKKLSKETFEMKEKVQQSLRALSEYLVLVIDAAGLNEKIDKLSSDKTLDKMTTINL